MPTRLSVVLSQGQSDHPAKRGLEEEIAGALLMERGIELTVISNLYDLTVDSTGILAMQGITGPMVVVSWLYDRAARWTLDRYDIHGQVGTVLLLNEDEEEDENEETLRKRKRRLGSRMNVSSQIGGLYCLIFARRTTQPSSSPRFRGLPKKRVPTLSSWATGLVARRRTSKRKKFEIRRMIRPWVVCCRQFCQSYQRTT